ncbi:MAG: MsnO8 family LLM class oxidoreductase [Pseudolabrys sp.]
MIPLSVLDLSPVSAGSTAAQALRNSLDLARLADRLGYTRYWVAEHHKAFYPGRIDLGLGRAPGTNPATSYMLRRRQGISEQDDFLERFQELMLLETRGFPEGHPFHKVEAMPSGVKLPPIFLLGSSDYSAQLAGHIGAAFAFAHHFANFDAVEAMRLYRDNFRPSASHSEPCAILATHVVCADTDEEAARLASTVELNFVRRAKGEYLPLASPEEAQAYDYTPVDRARIAQNASRLTVGAPATVKARLEPLIAATKANELMITSMMYDHAARKHCYELLAQAFLAT